MTAGGVIARETVSVPSALEAAAARAATGAPAKPSSITSVARTKVAKGGRPVTVSTSELYAAASCVATTIDTFAARPLGDGGAAAPASTAALAGAVGTASGQGVSRNVWPAARKAYVSGRRLSAAPPPLS